MLQVAFIESAPFIHSRQRILASAGCRQLLHIASLSKAPSGLGYCVHDATTS